MLKRLASTQQVTANLHLNIKNERGLRLVICVIRGQKISEQFAILEDWINRVAQKTGVAAKFTDSNAIARLITANCVLRRVVHLALFPIVKANFPINE